MVSTKKNRRIVLMATVLGALALAGSVIFAENPTNLLKLNAGESESRWSKSLTINAADLKTGSVTVNGISFTVSGVTNDGTTATFAKDGYIQADAAASTSGTTCHGVTYYGMKMTGLTTAAGGGFAYTNAAAATSGKTWYNMINNRGEGENRGKYTYTDGSTEAKAIAYTNITHDWSDQRDDNDSSGVWIELPQPRFTAIDQAFSLTSLTFYYECQTTGDTYSVIYANEARGIFNLTREDGTSRLPYSFEVGKPLTFKVTPTAAYSDYVFTVAWGHTKSLLVADHGTTLTPSSGVYTLTPDSTTLTSILVTYAKASYGVTFSSDAATISYTDSTGTALADQSGTYEKGSNVYFKLTYATGCHGGTVKVSDTALTADANSVYTISSIAAATTVKLVDPYYTLANTPADFEGTNSDMTITNETTEVNTAGGYQKSTKIVTPSTGGNNPYAHPRVLQNIVFGDYKEIHYSIRADGTAYWEQKLIGADSDYGANNSASWIDIKIVQESASVYRLFAPDWTSITFAPSDNLMNLRLKLGTSGTFYISELIGIKADTAYTSPYTVIADSPMAATGTENTTVYPTSVSAATKSTEITYGWGKQSFTSLALSSYKEVLFFVQTVSGSAYSGLAKDGSMLGTEDAFNAGSWRVMRLVKVSDGNYTVVGNNYVNSTSLALANLNELTFQANGTYYFSQVFGIAA